MSTARDPKSRGFVFSFYFSCKGGAGPTWLKGGDGGTKVLRRGRLGHGERFSTIVRIHRVICNCDIVSGHFMQRHKASELQGSDFLDTAVSEGADSQGLSEPAHVRHHSLFVEIFCFVLLYFDMVRPA